MTKSKNMMVTVPMQNQILVSFFAYSLYLRL